MSSSHPLRSAPASFLGQEPLESCRLHRKWCELSPRRSSPSTHEKTLALRSSSYNGSCRDSASSQFRHQAYPCMCIELDCISSRLLSSAWRALDVSGRTTTWIPTILTLVSTVSFLAILKVVLQCILISTASFNWLPYFQNNVTFSRLPLSRRRMQFSNVVVCTQLALMMILCFQNINRSAEAQAPVRLGWRGCHLAFVSIFWHLKPETSKTRIFQRAIRQRWYKFDWAHLLTGWLGPGVFANSSPAWRDQSLKILDLCKSLVRSK